MFRNRSKRNLLVVKLKNSLKKPRMNSLSFDWIYTVWMQMAHFSMLHYFQQLLHSLVWEPRGVSDDYECEVIENDAPVSKHIPLHRPGPLPEEFFRMLEAITYTAKKDEPAIVESTASKE